LIKRSSQIGVPKSKVLVWELPRMILWRAYNRIASILYAFIDQQQWLDKDLKSELDRHASGDQPIFYVIVVPNVLHFFIPAIRLVQHHIKLVFILNGIVSIEEHTVRKEFPDVPVIRLWTIPKSSWPHGHLLNLLLRNSEVDFGILDHDFFLFDASILDQLHFNNDEFAICGTTWRNKHTGKQFPGTHLLYIRAATIRDIMLRYRVGSQLYKKIPGNVESVLISMGLSLDNPPKEYQSFFDSFLLLSALAIHEGYRIQNLALTASSYVHIGGTSIGLQSTKDATHRYISAQFLSLLSNTAVYSYYRQRGVETAESVQKLRLVIDPKILGQADTLIKRIESNNLYCTAITENN